MHIEFDYEDESIRLENVRNDWNDWFGAHPDRVIGGAILRVVHTAGNYSSIETWLQDARAGGGVCFISGGPGGVQEDLRERVSEWPNRWHILAYSVSENAQQGLRMRFASFLQSVATKKPGDDIPWGLLYPSETFENLIAFYLWCLAGPSLKAIKKGIEIPPEIYDMAALAADELGRVHGVSDQVKANFREAMDGGARLDLEDCRRVVDVVRPVVGGVTA